MGGVGGKAGEGWGRGFQRKDAKGAKAQRGRCETNAKAQKGKGAKGERERNTVARGHGGGWVGDHKVIKA